MQVAKWTCIYMEHMHYAQFDWGSVHFTIFCCPVEAQLPEGESTHTSSCIFSCGELSGTWSSPSAFVIKFWGGHYHVLCCFSCCLHDCFLYCSWVYQCAFSLFLFEALFFLLSGFYFRHHIILFTWYEITLMLCLTVFIVNDTISIHTLHILYLHYTISPHRANMNR